MSLEIVIGDEETIALFALELFHSLERTLDRLFVSPTCEVDRQLTALHKYFPDATVFLFNFLVFPDTIVRDTQNRPRKLIRHDFDRSDVLLGR